MKINREVTLMHATPKHAQPKGRGRHMKPKERSPHRASRRRNTFGITLMATLLTLVFGAPTVAQADGGKDHPAIDEVKVTHPSECGVDDGTIRVETKGERERGYIYTYDVVPGQDNGYSDLGETETGLASGEYEVQLLERREYKETFEDWEVYETTTVTVRSNCVTVEASGDCETVAVTYANTTNHPYFGDIRVDGEAGEADVVSTTEKHQGPLPLTVFGLRYQNVDVPPNATTTHEVNFEDNSGEHTVEYRVARGPEQLYYSIGWGEVTVDCGEPEPPQDGQDGADGKDGEDGQDGEVTTVTEVVEIETPTRINTGR